MRGQSRLAWPMLICCCTRLCTLAADDGAPACPKPSKELQASCKEISYNDLPAGAKALLQKLKCEVRTGSNYNYGSAVDLNGDGSLEYQFCCHEAPHGPCGAVLVGKVGTQWKNLTAKEGLLGFEGACTAFVILDSQSAGFHDICLPNECSPRNAGEGNPCSPMLWQYDARRHTYVDATPERPSRQPGAPSAPTPP
jgi:hypothetical protein